MAAIELRNLSKRFSSDARAVEDVSLSVPDGAFGVIVGPSGCGKTTLLRLIAGLEKPDRGEIRIDGGRVNRLAPDRRGTAMVFQDHALYPHLSVRSNLEFPLRTRGVHRAERARRVLAMLQLLELSRFADREPGELSGGERQRTALGRALIIEPRVLLLDEPLSNLDVMLRDHLRREIRRIHHSTGTTFLYVTHDQDEALGLADHLAVMHDGAIRQFGAPGEVYDWPANRFVASFLGRPAMNLLEGNLVREQGNWSVHLAKSRLPIAEDLFGEEVLASQLSDGQTVVAGFRPAAAQPVDTVAERRGVLDITIESEDRVGEQRYIIGGTADGTRITVPWRSASAPVPGEIASYRIDPAHVRLFRADREGTSIGHRPVTPSSPVTVLR
ncbi:MAG: ABC transporter ATP-binding protein [Phycisphaerales bacterium]|nr:MAG: ABC transporter ATP-binding protein [Phycisphaerales bacterium]